MNRCKLLCGIVGVVVLSMPAQAEFIPDPGVADTVDLVFSVLPDAGNNELQVRADLHVYHDTVDLTAMSMGFTWDNPNLQMDSAIASPVAASAFDFLRIFYYSDMIDSTNARRQFLFAGARMTSGGFSPMGSRQHLASYYFTLSDWDASDSIVIDTARVNRGANWTFVITTLDPYLATWVGTRVAYDDPCCVGPTGNLDMDPSDNVDIADLTFLSDYLFGPNFPALPCYEEANVDQAGVVDIADMTLLIDHLFINFTPLEDCP